MTGKLDVPLVHRSANRVTSFSVLAGVIFLIVFSTSLPHPFSSQRPYTSDDDVKAAVKHLELTHWYSVPTLETTTAKYAFATFLAGDGNEAKDEVDEDKYFVATRILAYQLLHAPETRSPSRIPLVVLVSADVSNDKRARLRDDGAIVYEAPPIGSHVPEWQNILAKIRVLELTQFERIAFLDADTVLTGSLETVFCDAAVELQRTGQDVHATLTDEVSMPETYAFAAMVEMNCEHGHPPTEVHHDLPDTDLFHAGFFVVQPSVELFNYYLSLVELANRFSLNLMEHHLLNHVHRPQGNMPWRMLDLEWNINCPSLDDLRAGVRSLHAKWWAPDQEDLALYLHGWRWRMEGFHEARDNTRWDKVGTAATKFSVDQIGGEGCVP